MRGHLIALAVCLVLAIVVTVAAVKLSKGKKKLVRGNAWLAFVLAVVIILNLILTGPVYSIVNLAMAAAASAKRALTPPRSFAPPSPRRASSS